MKVSELTGAQLDLLVARAEGFDILIPKSGPKAGVLMMGEGYLYQPASMQGYFPSTNWAIAGPIIDRYRIELRWTEDKVDAMAWEATQFESGEFQYGPTPLIAAMRAFVASKYGDNVSDIAEK